MTEDFYEILQVSPRAEQEVIESAYRRLAQKYHPDINTSPDASERMKKINAAYDVLGDPARRAVYDQRQARAKTTPRSGAKAKSAPTPGSAVPPAYPTSSPNPLANKGVWGTIGTIILIIIIVARFANVASRPTGQAATRQPTLSLGFVLATSSPTRVPTQIVPTRVPATATITQIQRTPTVRPNATAAVAFNNDPGWVRDLVRIPERQLDVCVDSIGVYGGPGFEYPIIDHTERGWYWKVFGYVGDWWYIGYDEQKRDGFIPRYAMCEQQATPLPNVSQPTATINYGDMTLEEWCQDGNCSTPDSRFGTPPLTNLADLFYSDEYPTPSAICNGYKPKGGVRLFARKPYVRAITRPNGIKVYYEADAPEYQDEGENGVSEYLWCPAEAEAKGYVNGKP